MLSHQRDCSVIKAVLMWSQPDSEPLEATFELNDTLYAKANIPTSDEVYIWLGVSITLLKSMNSSKLMLHRRT